MLTAHYRREHPAYLAGPRAADGDWQPRSVRLLRALADAPDGLSTESLVDLLAEGIAPRRLAVRRYSAELRQLARTDRVEIGRKDRGPGGAPRNIWRLTGAGQAQLAAVDEAPVREQLLRDAREWFGPATPTAIRRRAAAILRGAGFSARQIGPVFGVRAETIAVDQRHAGPVVPVPDAVPELRKLALAAEEIRDARKAVQQIRPQVGPATPIPVRAALAVAFSAAGLSAREIGDVFGVSISAIQRQLRGHRPGMPGPGLAARIRELAGQAVPASQSRGAAGTGVPR